mmetsp:Transcript_78535/g.168280  ORF Transcript_78535/g.168280 Transcript_78535/m.168280 type:complete len:370 (-) Transcript_78535:798-1907(-)
MRLLLLPRLQAVHLAHLHGQHRHIGADDHAHGQAVARIGDESGPLACFVGWQLVFHEVEVLREVDEPIELFDRRSEARADAEGSKVFGLHSLGAHGNRAQGIAVDPEADTLLDAQLLVHLEAWGRANGLDQHITSNLSALLCVQVAFGQPLHVILYDLHEPIPPCEEVDICHTEDGLLLEVSEGPVLVSGDRVASPDIEPYEVVHLLEALTQDVPGNGPGQVAHQPRDHLHAAEIPRAAHHPNLLATMLDQGTHVLDGERPVSIQHRHLLPCLFVVHLVEGAVLNVAAEIFLAGDVDGVGNVQEAGPGKHSGADLHPAITGRIIGRDVLAGVRPILDWFHLLHQQVEHGMLVQPVLPGRLSYHRHDLVL